MFEYEINNMEEIITFKNALEKDIYIMVKKSKKSLFIFSIHFNAIHYAI